MNICIKRNNEFLAGHSAKNMLHISIYKFTEAKKSQYINESMHKNSENEIRITN